MGVKEVNAALSSYGMPSIRSLWRALPHNALCGQRLDDEYGHG